MRLKTRVCVLGVLLLATGCGYKSKFTDQFLEQRFRSNEQDFTRIVKMFKEDSALTSVNQQAARSYNVIANLPQQRSDDYRALLKKLHLVGISRGEKTGNIYLATWSDNDFFVGGSNQFYVYAELPPAEKGYLTDSLDDLRKMTDAYAFKRIANEWYLHVDNW